MNIQTKEIINKMAVARFLRTFLPQVPALVAEIGSATKFLNLPGWVAPTLSLIGVLATTFDKYAREMGWY
jgi:hypothetical protein